MEKPDGTEARCLNNNTYVEEYRKDVLEPTGYRLCGCLLKSIT